MEKQKKNVKKSSEKPVVKASSKKSVSKASTKSKEVVVKETKNPKTSTKKTSKVVEVVADTKKNDIVIDKNVKDNSEIKRMIFVVAILVVLLVVSCVIGLTRNVSRDTYQAHVGINQIDVDKYLEVIDTADDTSLIYIARPTCSFCEMFEPILTSVLQKYNIGVEYVDISAISTQEEWDTFYNSNSFLAAGEWGTPTILVYKNKELVDINSGYVDEATLVEFLKKNELIKD